MRGQTVGYDLDLEWNEQMEPIGCFTAKDGVAVYTGSMVGYVLAMRR